MPERKKVYRIRRTLSMVVAIMLRVALDHVYYLPLKKDAATPGATVQVQQDDDETILQSGTEAPDDTPPQPQKPNFAPPLEFSMMGPLLPEDIYQKEEDKIEPPWIKNAVPSTVEKNKPRIVIIIDDMGMDRVHTREAMDLPGPLTFAFLPYADALKAQTEMAKSKGHELMVHVPMEPLDSTINAGPEVLKTTEKPDEFDKVLKDDLSAFDGYVGINNHMGSKMTQDRPGMQRLMVELKKRGLLFVDSKTIGNSVAEDEAKKAGIPYAARDVFLDHEETYEAVEGALDQVEKTALHKGLAVAIGHPKPETLKALREWLPTLKAKGIELVPVSAAVIVPEGANESEVVGQ